MSPPKSQALGMDRWPAWIPSSHAEPSASSVSDPSTGVNEEKGLSRSMIHSPCYESRHRLPSRERNSSCIRDSPLGFSTIIQTSPQLMPVGSWETLHNTPMELFKTEPSNHVEINGHAMRIEEKQLEREGVDELVKLYINLDSDHCKRFSFKEDGYECSDNEVQSQVIGGEPSVKQETSSKNEKKEGVERSADSDVTSGSRQRRRSTSDILNVENEKAAAYLAGRAPSNSFPGNSNLEFLINGVFTEDELRKIRECAKLTKMVLSEPKRVRRC